MKFYHASLIVLFILVNVSIQASQNSTSYTSLFNNFQGLEQPITSSQQPSPSASGASSTQTTTQSFGGISEQAVAENLQRYATATQALNQSQQQTQNPSTVTQSEKRISSLLGDPTTSQDVKLNLTVRRHTTASGTLLKIKPNTKHTLPPAVSTLSKITRLSFTQVQNEARLAENLLSDDATLSQAYTSFMNYIKNVPSFIPMFRKIHITALHQIYLYLVSLYVALNMTNIDDIETYIKTEKSYGLNKKTLIINHLINLIQAQLNQALLALFPGMPSDQAIKVGMACLKQDYGTNLDILILDMEQSILTLLGLEQITQNQCASVVAALNNPNVQTFLASVDQGLLSSAKAKILQYGPTFTKQLTSDERSALVDALSALTSHYSETQTQTDIDSLIQQLGNSSQTQSMTISQLTLLQKTIGQCAFGTDIVEEIAIVQSMATKLTNNDNSMLSQQEFLGLQSIMAYILSHYEKDTSDMIESVITQLGKLQPQARELSPVEQGQLQTIATQINSGQLSIDMLSPQQRALLSLALQIFGTQSTTLNSAQMAIAGGLGTELAAAAVQQADLTTDQQTTLAAVLQILQSYTLQPYSAKVFQQALTPEQNDLLQSLGAKLTAGQTFDVKTLSQDEQLFLLYFFQNLSRIVETRLGQHTLMASALNNLLDNDTNSTNSLFANLSADQYEALSVLDHYFSNLPAQPTPAASMITTTTTSLSTFSFSVIDTLKEDLTSPLAQQSPVSKQPLGQRIRQALTSMFTVPTDTKLTSYLTILESIRTNHFQTNAINSLVGQLSYNDSQLFQDMAQKVNAANFTLQNFTSAEVALLQSTLQTYKQLLSQEQSTSNTSQGNLADAQENTVQTMCSILGDTHKLEQMQSDFLNVLNQYLLFFEQYTATLNQTASSSTDPNSAFAGLTEFATHAQNIVQALQGTQAETLNPPLFFYDDATLRSIKLLPRLATLVENTQQVSYPTFGITIAITGQAKDSQTGIIYDNQIKTGDGQILMAGQPKFFFKQQDGTEFQGSQPSWISTTTVSPSNPANFASFYTTNRPLVGEEGFYMNIPVFSQDAATGNAIIRLYEQPICAQPAWLNSASGVITMLRGCLGDFKSLLDQNIFDPCLTMIFQRALAYGTTPTAAQQTFMQLCSQQCNTNLQQRYTDDENMLNTTQTSSTNSAQSILQTPATSAPAITGAPPLTTNLSTGSSS